MKTAKQTALCIAAWFVAISVAALAHAEIIHGRASGPVSQVYWNHAGESCLQVGDDFEFEFIAPVDLKGKTVEGEALFTGNRNGKRDGVADWSSNFTLTGWPGDQGFGGGGGRYGRKIAGDAIVYVDQKGFAAEWEWLPGGSSVCMVRIGPLDWSREVMYQDGDANKNGIFDSSDLIQVFAAGQYEDGIENNSTWETGDWTGDREFDSNDMVAAMITGTYRSTAAIGVPEPSSLVLALLGFALMVSRSRFDS